jgi:hypothetical protein
MLSLAISDRASVRRQFYGLGFPGGRPFVSKGRDFEVADFDARRGNAFALHCHPEPVRAQRGRVRELLLILLLLDVAVFVPRLLRLYGPQNTVLLLGAGTVLTSCQSGSTPSSSAFSTAREPSK